MLYRNVKFGNVNGNSCVLQEYQTASVDETAVKNVSSAMSSMSIGELAVRGCISNLS